MTKLKYIFILCLVPGFLHAQELQATVRVNADQVTLTDKTVFKEMEKAMSEFVNNRRWTTDKVAPEEKIACTFSFIISTYEAPDVFKGRLQIQSSRPVYASAYNSVLINLEDENIEFKYNNFAVLDYQENQFVNNLSALLAFYSFTVVGLDYDSYGQDGGNPYYVKAQSIVNTAQNASEPGWKAFDGKANRNRYWLAENLMNARYKPFHEAWYTYHRKGLDQMIKDPVNARKEIYNSLLGMQKIFKMSSSLYISTAFFTAKADELISLYKDATEEEKKNVVALLTEINVQYANKWQTITSK